MDISEYQQAASATSRTHKDELKDLMIPLLGLSGEVGSLLSEYKKWVREGDKYRVFTDQVSEEIGDILWYLSDLATKSNLDLSDIAKENLAKIEARWGTSKENQGGLFGRRRYDDGYPHNEVLPVTATIKFFNNPNPTSGRSLEIEFNGEALGDPLSDNSYVEDGYRYHDVFHFANAFLLGWSPVIRKLLKRKRKSNKQVDEVEDGARAQITEEAISTLVFNHAADHSFFVGSSSVEYEIIRTIKIMTRGFEVRDRSSREWEFCILKSYEIWRKMTESNGGVLIADADKGSLDFVK